MELENMFYCSYCKENFTKVYIKPCTHNICTKCEELKKNGPENSCLICSNSDHQDEVNKNSNIKNICLNESQNKKGENEVIICGLCDSEADKYCESCSLLICLKCISVHLNSEASKEHKICDRNSIKMSAFKSTKPNCEKHNEDLTVYCRSCKVLLCKICSLMKHQNHDTSEKIEEVFANFNSVIKNKIDEIDDEIRKQNELIKDNKIFETTCVQKYEKVCSEIEGYAKELKTHIDNLTKIYLDKIITIKNDFIKSIQAKLKDIADHISSLTNMKSYFQEVVNKGSNVDVLNLQNEINETKIEPKKPKIITKMEVSFQIPDLEKLITSEISKSIEIYEIKDIKIMLKKATRSACVFKQNIYAVNFDSKCVDLFNIETGKHQSSINIQQHIARDVRYAFLLNTANNLFLYTYHNSFKCAGIFVLRDAAKAFVELKKFEWGCSITATPQQALLVRTASDLLIELSESGNELKRLKIPDKAVLSSSVICYTIAYKFKSERYVVTSYDYKLYQVSLFDAKVGYVGSFSRAAAGCPRTCTDGKACIFVLEISGKLIVLSADLRPLYEFDTPGVENICYDLVNDKVILVKKTEIVYFSYYLGMQVVM